MGFWRVAFYKIVRISLDSKRRPFNNRIGEGSQRRLTEAPRLYVALLSRSGIQVLIPTTSAKARRQFLIQTELFGAGETRVDGILWEVEGDDCGIGKAEAFAEGHAAT